jgi:hypothetical protein
MTPTPSAHESSRAPAGQSGAGGRRKPAASWLGLRPGTLLALVGIAVLLVPLSALSQPADSSSKGGKLAKLREQF